MSLISILMPVKNAMPFLEACLHSILSQVEKEWELIAVNDHTDDRSNDVLLDFASRDNRIQVWQNEGRGIIPALRLAYRKSKGPFITRMDADDLMPPLKLQRLKKALLEEGTGHLAIGQVRYFAEQGVGDGYMKYEQWLNGLTAVGENFQEIYKECVIPSPCWMLHREDVDRVGAFDNTVYPEDYDLCFRMYEAGLKCLSSQDVLHLWRDHASRFSRNDPHYADNRFLDLKLFYFLKLERNAERPLVVWGAGKKGKILAKKLTEQAIAFYWICNNKSKIGKDIYGQKMRQVALLSELINPQLIIAVAGEEAQKMIRLELSTTFKKRDRPPEQSISEDRNIFFFC